MISGTTLIKTLLESNHKVAAVLFQNGLDYFKCLDQNLNAACKRYRVDEAKLILRLEYTLNPPKPESPDFNLFDCGHIILYLINTHHAHSRITLPMIHYHIKKNEQLHGAEFPQLMMLNTFFDKFRSDFMYHLRQEEEIVFPYIHQLEESISDPKNQKLLELPDLSIQSLNARHISDNEDIEDIQRLTNYFRTDGQDPLHYRILMAELEDLYHNLKEHSEIEENILFKKAEDMEKLASQRMRKLLGLE